MAVAFTRDGSQIITDSGPNIVFWNTQNGEIANQVTTPAPIRSIAGNAVAFSPDSTLLASGSNDNTVRVWSVADGKEVLRLPHRFGVIAVAFSPDNQALASGGWENLVRIWDLADGRQIATFDHRNAIHSLAFSAAQQDLTFARPLIGGPDALGPVERWS